MLYASDRKIYFTESFLIMKLTAKMNEMMKKDAEEGLTFMEAHLYMDIAVSLKSTMREILQLYKF